MNRLWFVRICSAGQTEFAKSQVLSAVSLTWFGEYICAWKYPANVTSEYNEEECKEHNDIGWVSNEFSILNLTSCQILLLLFTWLDEQGALKGHSRPSAYLK